MKYLIADIETTGLELSSKFLCACSKELDGNEFTHIDVNEFIKHCNEYDCIVFHNGSRFDVPYLQQYGFNKMYRDTLIDAKLAFPKELLTLYDSKNKFIPSKLYTSYSLKAFGYRFDCLKGSTEQEFNNYTEATEELIAYCKQDVIITEKLFKAVNKTELLPNQYNILYTEYLASYIMNQQERYGFKFDLNKALELYTQWYKESQFIETNLRLQFGITIEQGEFKKFTRKHTNNRGSYPITIVGDRTEIKVTTFNPKSRQQIAKKLKELGVEFDSYTPKGTPNMNTKYLEDIGYTDLAKYLKLSKDLGQLFVGENSLIKLYNRDTKRIHGYVDFLSCSTHRASHSKPNLAQLNKTKEMRELLVADENKVLIGLDFDQQELMLLGHYLQLFGNSEYLKSIALGSKEKGDDIHTLNQKLAGLPKRDLAKTLIYATLYGAGDLKIGDSLTKEGIPEFEYTRDEYNKAKNKIKNKCENLNGDLYFPIDKMSMIKYHDDLVLKALYGKLIKDRLTNGVEGLNSLTDSLAHEIKTKNHITSLDGRYIHCETQHKGLNYLLQSSGAIYMKWYLRCLFHKLKKYTLNKQYGFVANIHDALVIECDKEIADDIAKMMEQSCIDTSEYFNFSYPITGQAIIGDNFYDIF